jgi:hypothetical protein
MTGFGISGSKLLSSATIALVKRHIKSDLFSLNQERLHSIILAQFFRMMFFCVCLCLHAHRL